MSSTLEGSLTRLSAGGTQKERFVDMAIIAIGDKVPPL